MTERKPFCDRVGKRRPLGTSCQTGSIRSLQVAGIDSGTVRARPVSFLAVVGSSHSGAAPRRKDRRRARRKCHRANARFGHTAAAAVIGSVLITGAAFSHPSHASWLHRELHRRPKWLRSHARTAPISAHPSHVSWPHRELHRRPKWLRPHASPPQISAHPLHASWPHRELHRRLQWQGPHA